MWANGMEGGHVHGRDEVRKYWTRQWAMIDPHVEPVAFAHGPQGELAVEVHQLVRDLKGNILVDQIVGHLFRIENGLIRRFDIRGAWISVLSRRFGGRSVTGLASRRWGTWGQRSRKQNMERR